MENGREIDRWGQVGLREEDGANWRGFGITGLVLMLAMAVVVWMSRRGPGERIAAAETRMEPRPVVY